MKSVATSIAFVAASCLLVASVAADSMPTTSTSGSNSDSNSNTTAPVTAPVSPTRPALNPACIIERNFDYVGNDIANVPAPNVEMCCDICTERADCGAYTWSPYNSGTCWLKSSRGKIVAALGVHSGLGKLVSGISTCNAETGVDYEGFDTIQYKAANAGMCCDVCKSFFNCRAFSWSDFNGGTCFLKSERGKRVYRAGVVSASVYPEQF